MNDKQDSTEVEQESQANDANKDVSIDSEKLIEALDQAKKKAEENWDLLLRARAEMENARRRAQIDVENAHKYGSEKFARDLLQVIDSMEHGLEASKGGDETIKAIHEGMELTYKLLIDTMAKHGVERIFPEGEKFDPKCHEALSMQPSADKEPNTILQVIQPGFILNERVLRPARVIVAKAAE